MTIQPTPVTLVQGGGAGAYPVVVGRGLLDRLPDLLKDHAPGARYAVISDDRVGPIHGARAVARCRSAGLDAQLITFPAGEASKTRKQWSILTDALLDQSFGRDSTVVAVGGGVTTDLAGFVAATFMRGVALALVPTSYLAMIDASVGGKTGVDVRQGKNLVGAFHAPRLVLVDPATLETLPRSERVQGLVEAFKHGAILDVEHFVEIERSTGALIEAETEIATLVVRRSVALKAMVVSSDEREHGYRQILNFGHTYGHAIEAASAYRVGHGRAVAAGMLLEASLGERLGVTEPGTGRRLTKGLAKLGLPPLPALAVDDVLRYLGSDKKVRSGKPRFVLLARLGAVDGGDGWSREIPESLVREVLEEELSTS